MYEYRVVSKATELPRGSSFITVPEFPLETGSLALFATGEFPDERLIVGRWYPDVAGCDWIWQPQRWIRVARDVIVRIIGRVILLPSVSTTYWLIVCGGVFAQTFGLIAVEGWDLLTTIPTCW
jgi:hypothetical protein